MNNDVEDLKNQVSNPVPEKKFPVSGGTAVFLLFNVFLIIGFCKFSFYVLKNHRSVVERDSLIKTYVDVQPRAKTKTSAYLALNTTEKMAPAPFFIKKDEAVALSVKEKRESVPLPILTEEKEKEKNKYPVIARTAPRPPVIRPDIQTDAVLPSAQEEPVKIKDKHNDFAPVSLDNLMVSGLNLLNESEETIAASELLLQEEALPDPEPTAKQEPSVEKQIVEKKAASSAASSSAVQKKSNKNPATRWVDVAELRRQLEMSTQATPSKQKEINRENKALLEMNGAKQVASLDTKTVSDSQISPSSHNIKSETPAETVSQKAVTDAVLVETAPQKPAFSEASVKTDEKSSVQSFSKPTQVTVVQDIPFAGTAQTPETPQKTTAAPVHQKALAGDSPSLWKVAKARGTPRNSMAVKQEEKTEKAQTTARTPAPEQVASAPKPEIIYRHGRTAIVTQNQDKKSLNWLDRQEAAVWTSMSQSDTPSVWSSAAETTVASSDRAKAFRVADEQPAETKESNVINSAPVRVIGEEAQPEAKENPILLPLGTPAPKAAPAPLPQSAPAIPATSPAMVPPVNPNGLTALSTEQPTAEKSAQPEENGLMNKFFSFFGKNETSGDLPNIGSGTPVPTDTDKSEKTDQASKKETGTKALFGAKNTSSEQSSQIKNKAEGKQIIPTELRLTFKPNSTEISAQSVKWIKAFGQRAKKDIQNAVEVRMSNTDSALQSKRFAIIRSTLIGVGMNEVQIIPVMTDRTPHTIVLRTIVLPEEGYTEYTTENSGIKERRYYKQW